MRRVSQIAPAVLPCPHSLTLARCAPPGPIRHVAIIGAGFSGALQAINLLRHDGPVATLIERRAEAGRGVAYSAAHPSHLLNVRAANMSALPDDPDHFVRWLAARRPGADAPAAFAPRIVYGDYLGELLAEAQARGRERLRLVHGEAIDVGFAAGRARVRLADGGQVLADAVVLALGNLPPHQPRDLAAANLPPDLYAPDPWAADLAAGLDDEDVVLAIGSGLTMVDVALLLDARGFRGRMIALSRRGLAPRPHVPGAVTAPRLPERPPLRLTVLVPAVRALEREVGWHAAVDALRPYTQDMWLGAPEAERSRFLRHLRPWWDVHRHRLAPQVAARIAALRAEGRLEIAGGKLAGFAALRADGVRVTWRPRGADAMRTLDVRRVINCSGPQGDLLRTGEPLLRTLLARGVIRPDAHHLGIDVNAQAETIAADGRANPRLLALGPMTRGAFWEIVAVPDIRVQTWAVARKLSNAHWVGGEGL